MSNSTGNTCKKDDLPRCHVCAKPATCLGVYEDPGGKEEFGCDDCCGHGGEDGWCESLDIYWNVMEHGYRGVTPGSWDAEVERIDAHTERVTITVETPADFGREFIARSYVFAARMRR